MFRIAARRVAPLLAVCLFIAVLVAACGGASQPSSNGAADGAEQEPQPPEGQDQSLEVLAKQE
ncbi:MAG TPA: hypothetical protein VIL08_02990, partial [Limnochorda sp.]